MARVAGSQATVRCIATGKDRILIRVVDPVVVRGDKGAVAVVKFQIRVGEDSGKPGQGQRGTQNSQQHSYRAIAYKDASANQDVATNQHISARPNSGEGDGGIAKFES